MLVAALLRGSQRVTDLDSSKPMHLAALRRVLREASHFRHPLHIQEQLTPALTAVLL